MTMIIKQLAIGLILSCLLLSNIYANGYMNTTINHLGPYRYYMKILVELARTQPQAPFAAMIVDKRTGKIISEGLNHSADYPLLHGEIVAMNNAVKKYPHINWHEMILLTTAEPCSMCISAIVWAGIPIIVYGSSIPYLEQHGWHQIHIRAKTIIKAASSFYKGKLVGGVLQDQTNRLFINL